MQPLIPLKSREALRDQDSMEMAVRRKQPTGRSLRSGKRSQETRRKNCTEAVEKPQRAARTQAGCLVGADLHCCHPPQVALCTHQEADPKWYAPPRAKYKPAVAGRFVIPALGRLKRKDCHKLESTVNSTTSWNL